MRSALKRLSTACSWTLPIIGLMACGTTPVYDVLFTGGTVIDGTGSDPYVADVGISGDRIVAVGSLDPSDAAEVIDVTGLVVTPGFIDAHSHAELDEDYGRDGRHFLTQGITTVVLGLDGGGSWEVAEQLTGWETNGIGVNALTFVGHGAIRREVLGMEDRAPTGAELDQMKAMVREAMEGGAFGLSTGLFYTPGFYSTTEEVIELGRIAAEWEGAIYDTHDRDLGATYQGSATTRLLPRAFASPKRAGCEGFSVTSTRGVQRTTVGPTLVHA